MKEGHGKKTFANGNCYIGGYKQGNQEGHGKYMNANRFASATALEASVNKFCGRHLKGIISVSFLPDGSKVATGGYDKIVKVWDSTSMNEINSLSGHTQQINSICFSANGRKIVTASHDSTVKVWDAETYKVIKTLAYPGYVQSACFSSDGLSILASGSDNAAKLFKDYENSDEEIIVFRGHTSWVHVACFSHDGLKVLTGSIDTKAKVWDATTGKELLTLEGHSGYVNAVAFSPDDRHVVTGSEDGTAKLWDTESGHIIKTMKGHGKAVKSASFSPNGHQILTAGTDGSVKLWDTDSLLSGDEVMTVLCNEDDPINSAVFSPDGQYVLTGGDDGVPKLWNLDAQVLAVSKMCLIDAIEDAVLRYANDGRPEYSSLEGTLFEKHHYLLHYPVLGLSVMSRFIKNERLDNIEWCARVSPRSLLLAHAIYKGPNKCTALEYSIDAKNTNICKYLSQVYTEMMLPDSAIVKSHRMLSNKDMNADYRSKGVPVCDLIEVKDLVLLAKIYPDLILKLVQKLIAVPQRQDKSSGHMEETNQTLQSVWIYRMLSTCY
jgi:WD40 repeat protein